MIGKAENMLIGDDGAPGGEHPRSQGDVHREKACH